MLSDGRFEGRPATRGRLCCDAAIRGGMPQAQEAVVPVKMMPCQQRMAQSSKRFLLSRN